MKHQQHRMPHSWHSKARRLAASAALLCAAGASAQGVPNGSPAFGASPPLAPGASVAQILYLAVPPELEWPDLKGPDQGAQLANWMQREAMRSGKFSQDPRVDRIARDVMAAQKAGAPAELRLALLDRVGREKTLAGEYAAGLKAFDQGVSVAREAGEVQSEALADLLVNSSVVRAARGDHATALAGLRDAYELYLRLAARNSPLARPSEGATSSREVKSERPTSARALLGQELALLNLGAVFAHTGQYADAYARYNQALALYPKSPSPAGASVILRGLARIAGQLGRPDESRRYSERADRAGPSVFERAEPGGTQRSIVLRGSGEAGSESAARESVPSALARVSPLVSGIPQPGVQPAPGEWLNPALGELRKLEQQATAAEAAGQSEAAMAAWRKAVVLAEFIGSADGLRNALAQLQRLYTLGKQPALSVFYGKQAVNETQRQLLRVATMDRDARRALANRTRSVFESLIATLLAEARLAEAEQAMWLQRAGASAGQQGRTDRMPFSAAELAMLQRDQRLATRWRQQMEASAALDKSSLSIAPRNPAESLEAMRKARFDRVEKELDLLDRTAAAGGPAASYLQLSLFAPQLLRLISQFGKTPCDMPSDDARVRAMEARVLRLRAKYAPPFSSTAMVLEAGLTSQKSPTYQAAGLSQDPMVAERLKCAEQMRLAVEQELGKPDPVIAQRLQDGVPRFAEEDNAVLEAERQALGPATDGAVALHYLLGEKSLWLLLVSASGRVTREVPVDRKTLDNLVGSYRSALQNRSASPAETAQRMYRLLVHPVQAELDRAQARTLIFGLDGSLRYMPFGALHDGQRWLVEKYALAVDTPGLARTSTLSDWRMVGFGSTLGGAGLMPLPGVADELRDLVRTAGDGNRGLLPGVVRLDREFTAEALRLALQARYQVVHIASHFRFVRGRADESFLLLGDGTTLPLAELRRAYRFDGVELVALSACDTALDNVDGYGQEFEGLAAILRQQGAAAVLATLWPVADASTGRFMRGFYAKQGPSRLSRAEALRRAQMDFIGGAVATVAVGADTRGGEVVSLTLPSGAAGSPSPSGAGATAHPFYWAPFVLSGDWR
jgi:CHAT domain-containing protein/tetratricopeptide (TPR) repeat protein